MGYDGVSAAELAKRLRAPSCLSLVKVTSTLDIVHELAGADAPAQTVVIADEQVAGRGRQGREWRSPAGAGVWLGYLSRPGVAVENGVVSLRTGLAVVQSLNALGASVKLKWPNDVLLEDRKVAGVLCEARWSGRQLRWIAIGIGINVHRRGFDGSGPMVSALDDWLPAVSRLDVLEELVPRLHALADGLSLSAAERRQFGDCDWLMGRNITLPVTGVASGIDDTGALLVRTGQGTERVIGGGVVTA